MAKLNPNLSFETQFRSVFGNLIHPSSAQIESALKMVCKNMGIIKIWPTHPKMSHVLNAVYNQLRLKING